MTKESENAYNRGTTLLAALEEYTPSHLWQRYVEIGGEASEFNPLIPEFAPPSGTGKPPFSNSPIGHRDEARWLKREMASALLDQLKAGELVALGYLRPKPINPEPQVIPVDLWGSGTPDFANSALLTQAEAYSEIRVCPAPRHPVSSMEAFSRRRPGAPSERDKILAAYFKLRDDSKIDFTRSLNANIPTIRKEAAARLAPPTPGKSPRGIGKEVIRRTLREQFQTDKRERSR